MQRDDLFLTPFNAFKMLQKPDMSEGERNSMDKLQLHSAYFK